MFTHTNPQNNAAAGAGANAQPSTAVAPLGSSPAQIAAALQQSKDQEKTATPAKALWWPISQDALIDHVNTKFFPVRNQYSFEPIPNMPNTGICAGLTLVWAYKMMTGQAETFAKQVEFCGTSSTAQLLNASLLVERCLAIIQFAQGADTYLHHTAQYFPAEVLSYLPLIESATNPYKIINQLKTGSFFVSIGSLASNYIPVDVGQLEKLVRPNDGNPDDRVYFLVNDISSGMKNTFVRHQIAIFYRQNTYYLYDSNFDYRRPRIYNSAERACSEAVLDLTKRSWYVHIHKVPLKDMGIHVYKISKAVLFKTAIPAAKRPPAAQNTGPSKSFGK